jgi:PAS domain S-box-containing protein
MRRAQKQTEEKYRALVEQVPAIIYIAALTLKSGTLYVSPQIEITGYTANEWIADPGLWHNTLHPDDRERTLHAIRQALKSRERFRVEYRLRARDGRELWIRDEGQLVLDANGEPMHVHGVMLDITERKQADTLLRQSEERYRTLAEAAHDIIFIVNPQGEIQYLNRFGANLFNLEPQNVIGKYMPSLFPSAIARRQIKALHTVVKTQQPIYIESKLDLPHGEMWVDVSLVPLKDESGEMYSVIGIARDITVRRRAESETARRANQLAALYETARDLAGEQDLSTLLSIVVKRATDLLNARRGGVYLYEETHGDLVLVAERNGTAPLGMRLALGEGMAGKVAQRRQPMIVENYQAWEGRSPKFEKNWIRAVVGVPMIHRGELIGVLNVEADADSDRVFNEDDIHLLTPFAALAAGVVRTARLFEETKRRANEFSALHEITRDISSHQENVRDLLQSIVDRAVELLHAGSGLLFLYNTATQDLQLTVGVHSLVPIGLRLKVGEGLVGRVAQTGEPLIVDNYRTWESRSPQLSHLPIGATMCVPLLFSGDLIGALLVAEIGDKTERKFSDTDMRLLTLFATHAASLLRNAHSLDEMRQRVDELTTLSKVSSALRYTLTPSEIMPAVLDQIMNLMRVDGALFALRDPHSGDTTIPIGRGKAAEPFVGFHLKEGEGVVGHVISTKYAYFSNDAHHDPHFLHTHLLGDTKAFACVPLIAQNETLGALWVGRMQQIHDEDLRVLMSIADSAASALHRARLGEQTEQRLRRLESLHNIDVTISSSFDLRLTLNIVLDQIIAQLGVDAADVLLFNSATQTLSYFAGRGFRASPAQGTQIKMGTGLAGKAAMSRALVAINDLKAAQAATLENERRNFNAEGFAAYYGMPLFAKGEIKGVLEIFNRAPLSPEAEWLGFLQALGTQTTIAIDNIQLFDNLQRINTNLNLSYDELLDSWARLADQRAARDEGYTRRAAELTLQLAQELNTQEIDQVDLRRGALLYDIGSLTIPEAILLKTDPLSPEELKVIQQHPENSRQVLSPIRQLQRALDIPCYHHERWDGSGYCLGFKGEEIPIAARIFAVVDVWMALRSPRPYRAAWSVEKVRKHLRAMKGVQFDPKVVEAFLTMAQER